MYITCTALYCMYITHCTVWYVHHIQYCMVCSSHIVLYSMYIMVNTGKKDVTIFEDFILVRPSLEKDGFIECHYVNIEQYVITSTVLYVFLFRFNSPRRRYINWLHLLLCGEFYGQPYIRGSHRVYYSCISHFSQH